MNKLIILGAGGHGKVIADIAQKQNKWADIVFLDDRFAELKSFFNLPVEGFLDSFSDFQLIDSDFIIAIGDNHTRLKWSQKIIAAKLNLVSIIDSSAVISTSAQIGAGSVVLPNAIINADAVLGIANIINTAAVVEHDCQLSDGVHLSPGSNLGGDVTLSRCCWVGLGASVKQGIRIGADTIVGVGAAVVNDLPDNIIAVGIPAKQLST